jgi:hypothetical protein
LGQKSTFSKSVQIDPKVSPMSQKRLAVSETAILSSIRGQNMPETTPCQSLHFERFFRGKVEHQLF